MLQTFLVPYVVDEPKRKRAFTPEMEKAAILCLCEAKRKKPRILRGTSEEIEYIVKLYYPLWSVPWKDKCIIIDGLGLSSVTIPYDQVPDVTDFTEDLKRSSVSFNLFRKTLKKHSQTFSEFVSVSEKTLEAVIGEESVLKSLSSLINQAENVEKNSGRDVVFVPAEISREEAESKAAGFVDEWRRLHAEVEALQYALEVLNEETEHHKEKVSIEIEQMWKDYEERISKMKNLADKRIKKLIKEKEKETKKAAKLHEKRMKKALMEERKVQERIEKLRSSLRETVRRRKDHKRKYPKRSTARLDSRIKSYRERIKHLSESLRNLSRLKERIRRDEEEAYKAIEEKYLSMATKEMERVEILEQSRNLEVSKKREEIKEVEEASAIIEAQIKRLADRRTNGLRRLEEKALPFEMDETALIGIPFYLVQYKSSGKTRMDVYPPVIATSYDGVINKIRRRIFSFSFEARLQMLLNPRSPELNEKVFANFKKSLETNLSLREDVSEIGRSRNLLNFPSFKEETVRGMHELEEEGWLNAKEKENLLSMYVR